MKHFLVWSLLWLSVGGVVQTLSAAQEGPYFEPKVRLPFNKLYDYPDLVEAMRIGQWASRPSLDGIDREEL